LILWKFVFDSFIFISKGYAKCNGIWPCSPSHTPFLKEPFNIIDPSTSRFQVLGSCKGTVCTVGYLTAENRCVQVSSICVAKQPNIVRVLVYPYSEAVTQYTGLTLFYFHGFEHANLEFVCNEGHFNSFMK
jgi:hypothetical protein